jgi:hypothetical protein
MLSPSVFNLTDEAETGAAWLVEREARSDWYRDAEVSARNLQLADLYLCPSLLCTHYRMRPGIGGVRPDSQQLVAEPPPELHVAGVEGQTHQTLPAEVLPGRDGEP